jgi:nucleoid-associated protein YgaU
VQPFDNLSLIGRKLGVPWRSIYAANLALIGRTPNLIRVGWVLTIPGR